MAMARGNRTGRIEEPHRPGRKPVKPIQHQRVMGECENGSSVAALSLVPQCRVAIRADGAGGYAGSTRSRWGRSGRDGALIFFSLRFFGRGARGAMRPLTTVNVASRMAARLPSQ